MASKILEWRTDESLAVGKGATVQQFVATLGDDQLQIDVSPRGEGHLKSTVGKSLTSTMPKIGGKPFV
jgi:enoyl-[acyl-carrier protein] reductase I